MHVYQGFEADSLARIVSSTAFTALQPVLGITNTQVRVDKKTTPLSVQVIDTQTDL